MVVAQIMSKHEWRCSLARKFHHVSWDGTSAVPGALSIETLRVHDAGHSVHCLWPQPVQVVLMTIMPPHLQQYS